MCDIPSGNTFRSMRHQKQLEFLRQCAHESRLIGWQVVSQPVDFQCWALVFTLISFQQLLIPDAQKPPGTYVQYVYVFCLSMFLCCCYICLSTGSLITASVFCYPVKCPSWHPPFSKHHEPKADRLKTGEAAAQTLPATSLFIVPDRDGLRVSLKTSIN